MGTTSYSNGDIYSGDHDHGRNGQGKMDFVNGNNYTGAWVGNAMHGHGQMEYMDGTRYKGDWRYNYKEGRGVESYPDKSIFEGDFSMDEKTKGKLTMHDKTIFEGTWHCGYKHGLGTYDAGDGKKDVVKWDWDRKVETEEESQNSV